MWKGNSLDSSGFKDVDGDDDSSRGISITYVSQVDARQERNCGTNDISITVFPISKICMLSDLAGLVELDR